MEAVSVGVYGAAVMRDPLISIGVVAHASRAGAAKDVARRVRADFINFDSHGLLGCEGNHAAVQRHLLALGSVWSVVVEDDAVPVDGFRDQLAAALAVAPDWCPVIGLYLGRLRPPQYQDRIAAALDDADALGACWVTAPALLHGVGYAIRTDVLPVVVNYDSGLPADQHISRAIRKFGHQVAYTVPSLVDHADVPPVIVSRPDGDSRAPGRVAWRTGVRDMWTSDSVALNP